MYKNSILFMLMIATLVITFGNNEAKAGFPAPPGLPAPPAPPGFPAPPGLPGSGSVSVNINGYLPAPPGVYVQVDAGHPYYVERGHRVYLKRRPHHDNGHHYGHYKHHGHDH